ncbi:MAG: hypothetical protein NT139_02615 [Candidatus Woesearchaeota archaeon]|nr:hypothetical protein [Candidatus Woesearchaeota archaeon]
MIDLKKKNPNELPLDKVLEMRRRGLSNEDIIPNLKQQGYSYQETDEALNQADLKQNVEEELPEPPSPTEMQSSALDGETQQPQEQYQQPQPQYQESTQQRQIVMPMPQTPDRSIQEQIAQITESIIEEKWQNLIEGMGDLTVWRERVNTDLNAIKQEILRTQGRFENLQRAIISKISDYDKGIADVGTEIKALEKVFQNILQPLTSNIKELNKITERLKGK